MNETQAIHTLRHAVASIWTELEKETPDLDDAQEIADQVLELTKEYAKGKDLTNDGTGLDGWRQYLEKRKITSEK